MWLVLKLLCSILIFPFFITCDSKNYPKTKNFIEDAPLKMYLVEDIVQKVCNISLDGITNKSPAERARFLISIEEKLKKSARALGVHGTKYVNLIMRGVRAKAFEISHSDIPIETTSIKQIMDDKLTMEINQSSTNNITTDNKSKSGEQSTKNDENKVLKTDVESFEELSKPIARNNGRKRELLQSITRKIEILAKDRLSRANNDAERRKIMDSIRYKFIKKATLKHSQLHLQHEDIKNYADLVERGINIVMQRNALYNSRRMEFVFTNNINLNKDSQNQLSDQLDPIKPDLQHNNELEPNESANKSKSVVLRIDKKTTSTCGTTLEESCRKIKRLTTLKCASDNTKFNVLKLCDGVSDCSDSSDENNCGQQALETIHKANRLITYVDTSIHSLHCFPDIRDKSMLAKQTQVLSEVLKNQITFLEKHPLKDTDKLSKKTYNTEKNDITEIIREAVNVVESLTSALGLSMCPNFNKKKGLNKEDLEKQIRDASPNHNDYENCKCNGQSCLKACTPRCERICLEMYTLTQFECDAVSGGGLVSLDMICDGKLDCYDEIDERDCSEDVGLAKFEATHMYDYVLNEIELKTASIAPEVIRARLQSLHALVKKLQKLTLDRRSDVLEVKRIRQGCFEELSKVYDSALIHLKRNEEEILNMRFFLGTLKERLISALKRTNTGNDKTISSDGCVCRGNKCALPRCSKSCDRACAVEPLLTRFYCGEVSAQVNNSLPIELVCNGKENCPNGKDEKYCQKDVCRKHHIMLLRRKIPNMGKQHLGTALGEVMKSWRIKVTATLMIAENNDRPTSVVMFDLLHDMLRDLVLAYSSLEDRRDNTPVLKDFYDWSRIIIDTLKSCSLVKK